jgi:hypothetical protein
MFDGNLHSAARQGISVELITGLSLPPLSGHGTPDASLPPVYILNTCSYVPKLFVLLTQCPGVRSVP